VGELVRTFLALDQLQAERFPQPRIDVLVRYFGDDRKHPDRGDVSEAGQPLQCRLRRDWQPVQLPDHEVHDVVGVPLGVNSIEAPAPSCFLVLEREQAFFGERVKKLNHEKRVARGLIVHQPRERRGVHGSALKRIGDELCQIFARERR
jgi:hypothetical protein